VLLSNALMSSEVVSVVVPADVAVPDDDGGAISFVRDLIERRLPSAKRMGLSKCVPPCLQC
jgi:hypothetical protein